MPWDPQQYERFKAERYAPFDDLLGLIDVRPDLEVVDLGCGTGELSNRLQKLLPGSRVLGVDSSLQMLKRAQAHANLYLGFVNDDLATVTGDWDVIFSHAALQWVDDHPAQFRRLWSCLRPGGQLALQMPSNHQHATHRLIRELAAESPFVEALNGWQRLSPVLTIDAYAELLYGLGAEKIQVQEKIYSHLLPRAADLLEWVKGTALVPYLEKLTQELQDAFLDSYQRRIEALYTTEPVFYPFRRILLSAKKPA